MGAGSSRDCGALCGARGADERKAATPARKPPRRTAAPVPVVVPVSKGGVILPDNKGHLPETYYDVANVSEVGAGAFGVVRRVTSRQSGNAFAMKTIKKKEFESKVTAFKNEVEIQMSLDHSNIVRVYETFEDLEHVHLVQELCNGGELFDAIMDNPGKFLEKEVSHILRQITSGVNHMHTMGIAHRDLKPENFLLKSRDVPILSNTLKMIDFGISRRFTKGQVMTTKAGSMLYVAPEVLSGKYNEKCDVWSLGIILYILLSGCPPFAMGSEEATKADVVSGTIDFGRHEVFKKVSDDAKALVLKMCEVDVAQRLPAEDVLKEPWVATSAPSRDDPDMQQFQSDFLQKMRTFSSAGRFQKMALNMLARRADSDVMRKLRTAFERIDENGDGQLTLAEMQSACQEVGLSDPNEIQEMHQRFDTNGDGTIGYSEFLAGMMDRRACLKDNDLRDAFRVFDKDGNGTISLEEMCDCIRQSSSEFEDALGDNCEDDIKNMFAEADTDGDGQVTFEEFKDMIFRKE